MTTRRPTASQIWLSLRRFFHGGIIRSMLPFLVMSNISTSDFAARAFGSAKAVGGTPSPDADGPSPPPVSPWQGAQFWA